ncbi:hypothetical protein KP509_13G051200 [Ceratopteris richardii]|uniref:Uncharacterized protein n=1 Tax=Ceratopteris richardii TaxID=49495 RepID=A0A8T2TL23_CERRI|nr:hypothetical protein KP509_13G051200 [Ceratopteris richardii]
MLPTHQSFVAHMLPSFHLIFWYMLFFFSCKLQFIHKAIHSSVSFGLYVCLTSPYMILSTRFISTCTSAMIANDLCGDFARLRVCNVTFTTKGSRFEGLCKRRTPTKLWSSYFILSLL